MATNGKLEPATRRRNLRTTRAAPLHAQFLWGSEGVFLVSPPTCFPGIVNKETGAVGVLGLQMRVVTLWASWALI